MDDTEQRGRRLGAAALRRLRKYGLRVTCLRCRAELRHHQDKGRLRESRCRCGGPLFPSWMLEDPRFESKAADKVRREAQRARVFDKGWS